MDLYGTTAASPASVLIQHGPVSLTLQGGALRHIRYGEVEMIRQIAFLARDRDWGTLPPRISDCRRQDTAEGLHLAFDLCFQNQGAQLDTLLTILITETSIQVTATGKVQGRFETNRAGFTLLHPIAAVAGAAARVTHSDGTIEHGHFPLQIAPWQPFMDIQQLDHEAAGLRVTCRFAGDVFEMEDQRQWGDVSYKTYNRPLALPWPYYLHAAEDLSQSVTLEWQTATDQALPAPALPLPDDLRFPEMALVLTPEEARHPAALAALAKVAPQRLLCHLDATRSMALSDQCAAFAALQALAPSLDFDLELLCRFDAQASAEVELQRHAAEIAASGLRPASIFIAPSVDRQSTPPGSAWPACPPLEEIYLAAARAFPDLPRGGGVASFFPELNRKPSPSVTSAAGASLSFITHGLCPIVHAADDLSLFETLEAVPHIAASAQAIIGTRAYRIGPATIAMRQNPCGSRTLPNPGGDRVPMTDDDPRHRAAVGAAYAIGLITALLPFGIAVWTPAALLGPRGVQDEAGHSWPLTDVLHVLVALAGQPVRHAEIRHGIAHLICGTQEIRANLRPVAQAGLAAFGWEHREHG